jgi:pimeloyl-ACP methyl ester carboxylesterase
MLWLICEGSKGVKAMQTFNVNGTTLTGLERGQGELLILTHGAVGDWRSWDGVLDALAQHYRVITYSRRWHHPNPPHANSAMYTTETHAQDLLALITSCGGGPVRLLGHSYGAGVCAAVAAEHPGLVRCQVLAEPSLFGMAMTNPLGAVAIAQTAAATLHVVPLLKKGQSEKALCEFLLSILGKEDYARLSPRALAVMADNVSTLEPMLNGMSSTLSFTGKQAARVTAPTLLIEGEHTTTLFRATIKALANSLPNAQRAVLPGVGHGLHLEDPTAFSRLALEFLAKH